MSGLDRARSSAGRPPLGDATYRINNNLSQTGSKAGKLQGEYDEVCEDNVMTHLPESEPRVRDDQTNPAPAVVVSVPTEQQQRQAAQADDPSKRVSQISQTSNRRYSYKTQVGPWQLGKTLGKGSSARVRLCRHRLSGELAAVKIVPKRSAYIISHGSLAALHKYDDSLPERINGEMRVPLCVEREVAILKLIDHPNVMKVYDIWENRSEIYLVLEYVDMGDLFDYINTNGRLTEEGAMFFFRQIMSAVQHCHAFNICHRDLKPENILLNSKNQVKIADFGMAALHQTESHWLETSCGSPHYAAPELLKHKHYRGDRADVWSMGVILYAILSASLPFDEPDYKVLISRIKQGQYDMPEFLSLEAKDLIRRMLQVNPDTRITLKEMWRHPLIHKYDYLDSLGNNGGQIRDIRAGFEYTPLRPHEVDGHLVRQLRSMWHMYTEHQIKLLLMDSARNDQKLFYHLLQSYRQKQLENFLPEIAQSPSDYHHLHQPTWKKRVSTCEFNQPRANGPGRSVSKFTVISSVPDTDAGTVKSYDPYNSSRPMRGNSQVTHAKIIVHRNNTTSKHSGHEDHGRETRLSRKGTKSSERHNRMNSQRTGTTARHPSPGGSTASLRSGRQGTPYSRSASRRKRGVDFSHVKKRSTDQHPETRSGRRGGTTSIAGDSIYYPKPSKAQGCAAAPGSRRPKAEPTRPKLKIVPPQDADAIVNEEVRNFSNSIAKDCDDAFNSSMIESDISQMPMDDNSTMERGSSPFSLSTGTLSMLSPTSAPAPRPQSWDRRPLPPLPKGASPSDVEEAQIEQQSQQRHSNGFGKFVDQVNRLALPVLMPKNDRRVVSAPAQAHSGHVHKRLPSIDESRPEMSGLGYWTETERSRIVSAPPPKTPGGPVHRAELDGLDYLSRAGDTIRVVNSPTATSPVPKPLNVRKKFADQPSATGQAADLREAYMHGAIQRDSAYTASASSSRGAEEGKKKSASWFKRSSKGEVQRGSSVRTEDTLVTQETEITRVYTSASRSTGPYGGTETTVSSLHSQIPPPVVPAKKKAFGLLFWKSNKNEGRMSIAGPDYEDSPSPDPKRTAFGNGRQSAQGSTGSDSGVRSIEVQQNWLARLFGVKPATSLMCLVISRKRARQEMAIILKDWRRYGIRDVHVDKERNIVFARVGAKNYLNIKEVSFAVEIMTVIEHGKRGSLSIVRFTQERGAVSSFHKVVDTLKTVFTSRNLVVTDKRKSKMMIKTLNS